MNNMTNIENMKNYMNSTNPAKKKIVWAVIHQVCQETPELSSRTRVSWKGTEFPKRVTERVAQLLCEATDLAPAQFPDNVKAKKGAPETPLTGLYKAIHDKIITHRKEKTRTPKRALGRKRVREAEEEEERKKRRDEILAHVSQLMDELKEPALTHFTKEDEVVVTMYSIDGPLTFEGVVSVVINNVTAVVDFSQELPTATASFVHYRDFPSTVAPQDVRLDKQRQLLVPTCYLRHKEPEAPRESDLDRVVRLVMERSDRGPDKRRACPSRRALAEVELQQQQRGRGRARAQD